MTHGRDCPPLPAGSQTGYQSRGVTLLELLIVMTIMLMVTAATLPVIMPALQNRRMREASRLASSFISGARARAIETGRPVGVMLERFNGLPFAMQLSYVEVPPPYAGDTLNSKVAVQPNGRIIFLGQIVDPANLPNPPNVAEDLWKNLIRYGDVLRLDYKGPLYLLASQAMLPDPKAGQTIVDPPAVATPWHLFPLSGVLNLPANYATGVPYQIFRQPVRSSATPLQLPETTVVDLVNSGVGSSGTYGAGVTFNPVIIFAPNGGVDYVTSASGALERPLGSIYLLLGRRDLMPDVSKSGNDENLFDTSPANLHLSNFWVTIGHQSGQVTVAENARTTSFTDLAGARSFAQGGQSAGGR